MRPDRTAPARERYHSSTCPPSCMCVCVCARARACVRVHVCVRACERAMLLSVCPCGQGGGGGGAGGKAATKAAPPRGARVTSCAATSCLPTRTRRLECLATRIRVSADPNKGILTRIRSSDSGKAASDWDGLICGSDAPTAMDAVTCSTLSRALTALTALDSEPRQPRQPRCLDTSTRDSEPRYATAMRTCATVDVLSRHTTVCLDRHARLADQSERTGQRHGVSGAG